MRFILAAALGCLLVSCSNRDVLTERHARTTAESVIASTRPELRDFDRMEWGSLETVSPTEARGKAVLIYRVPRPDGGTDEERVPGTFVYHRIEGEGWVLDSLDFPNPSHPERTFSRQTHERVASGRNAGGSRDERPSGNRSSEDTTLARRPRPPRDSSDAFQPPGVDVPLSMSYARETAEKYVATAHPDSAVWRAMEFGAFAPMSKGVYTLPATLLVEYDGKTASEYRGAFVFTYEADRREWRLTRMAFHADGQAPIEKDVRPPIVVG